MKTICYDPYISAEAAAELGTMKLDTVAELISASDVISISVPLTKGTTDLISGELFDCFKPNALLINASRGGIVNEAALPKAVDEGIIAGAGLDVYTVEPLPEDNPLMKVRHPERFSFSPHSAWASREALLRLVAGVAKNIRENA